MREAHYHVVLPVPVKRVWQFVTDVRDWPKWLNDVQAVRGVTMPNIQAGMRFEVLRSGQHDAETWIVAEWEPGIHVRFAEFREDIQLVLHLMPLGTESKLHVQVAYPQPRGLLANMLVRRTPGARWAQALESSVGKLNNIFVFNQDIKLLHDG